MITNAKIKTAKRMVERRAKKLGIKYYGINRFVMKDHYLAYADVGYEFTKTVCAIIYPNQQIDILDNTSLYDAAEKIDPEFD